MITQETKLVKTWGGFDLTILKVNLNPLSWKNRSSYNKTYKPPRSTSYCYPPVELTDMTTCKLRIHRLLLSLDSPPNTSTPLVFSLNFNGSNWNDHQGVENFFSLKNPKFMWRKTPQRSHKRFTQTAIWATTKRG